MASTVVNVLWTSGWDSTYRVADLVLNHGRTVQPHYIAHWRWASLNMEQDRHEQIRGEIARIDAEAARKILPTRTHNYDNIPSMASAEAQLDELRKSSFIGHQYAFITSMALNSGLDNLELCVGRDDKREVALLEDNVEYRDESVGYYELIESPSIPALELFRPYRFPLLNISKVEMGERAAESGFASAMELTWFCHYPTLDSPCGFCSPCRETREDGLGRRVPAATLPRWITYMAIRKGGAVKRRIERTLGR